MYAVHDRNTRIRTLGVAETDESDSTSTATAVTTNGISGLLVGVAAIALIWYRRRSRNR